MRGHQGPPSCCMYASLHVEGVWCWWGWKGGKLHRGVSPGRWAAKGCRGPRTMHSPGCMEPHREVWPAGHWGYTWGCGSCSDVNGCVRSRLSGWSCSSEVNCCWGSSSEVNCSWGSCSEVNCSWGSEVNCSWGSEVNCCWGSEVNCRWRALRRGARRGGCNGTWDLGLHPQK